MCGGGYLNVAARALYAGMIVEALVPDGVGVLITVLGLGKNAK
jgi:hypothetical protein